MNLYEISNAIVEAYNSAIDAETGEIIDEAALAALDALEMARDEKVENIACWIKDINAEAAAIKTEKQALAARQAAAERKAESLKRYVQNALAGETFKSAKVAISYRKSESVQIAEGAMLPEKYLTYVEPTPNKVELKKALKAGEIIEGATLVTNSNMQIK